MISRKNSQTHSHTSSGSTSSKNSTTTKGAKKIIVKHVLHEDAPPAPLYRKPLAVGRHDKGYFLLLRETSDLGKHDLFLIESRDGEKFSAEPHEVTLRHADKAKTKEDIAKCRNFHFFCHDDDVVMTYTRFEGQSASLIYAVTKDMKTWVVAGTIKNIHANGVLVPEIVEETGDTVYFGGDMLRAAVTKEAAKTKSTKASDAKGAKKWSIVEPHRVPHWHFYDGATFRIVSAVPMDDKIAVFYESEVVVDILTDNSLNDQKVGEERFIKMGAAFFSQKDTINLLWQSELPLIELPLEKFGNLTMLGVVKAHSGKLRIYSASASGAVNFIEFDETVIEDHRTRRQMMLKKHANNPLLQPTDHEWEKEGSFNPTAFVLDGKVHLFYRAVGSDGLSRIGYAMTKDGVNILDRLKKPIYSLQNKATEDERDPSLLSDSLFHSGGSWGGCEDPKVTYIDDRIYLTYVAHNGTWPTRTAITSISTEDFLKKRWKWKKPALMSPPNVGSKSVVILPEKINGKYVVFHRTWPSIMIDMVSTLDFGEKKDGSKNYLKGEYKIGPRQSYWDSRKLSMGAAPIKTPQGWLAIYNAVDKRDSSKYKIGAMLLDLKDPRKVIARSRKPILSPEEWYENDGKPGVAYPGGAVNLDGILHVYYGGGDKVGCVATVSIKELVQSLLHDSLPHVNFSPVALA